MIVVNGGTGSSVPPVAGITGCVALFIVPESAVGLPPVAAFSSGAGLIFCDPGVNEHRFGLIAEDPAPVSSLTAGAPSPAVAAVAAPTAKLPGCLLGW